MKFHPCSSLSSNKITLSLSIVLLFLDSFCKSAITGPIDSLDTIRLSGEKSDAPIRLVEKGGRGGSRAYNHNSIQPPVKNRSTQQKQRQNTYIQEMEQEEQSQQQQRHHQQQQHHHHQQQQRVLQQETQTPTEQNETKNTNAKLNILEPPMDSILAGSNFKVSVQVLAENQDDFTDAYEKSSDGKICISLDDSPFHCGWSAIDGNIFFSNAIEVSQYVNGYIFFKLLCIVVVDHVTRLIHTGYRFIQTKKNTLSINFAIGCIKHFSHLFLTNNKGIAYNCCNALQ